MRRERRERHVEMRRSPRGGERGGDGVRGEGGVVDEDWVRVDKVEGEGRGRGESEGKEEGEGGGDVERREGGEKGRG